jgi:hypothetical protein
MNSEQETGHSPRNAEWGRLAAQRFHVCQLLDEDRPDLVLWDLEAVLADPEGATPASPMNWPA